MKFIIMLSIVFASLISQASYPSADIVEQNFKTCQQVNPHWQQNWGQYVIAFDLYTAVDVCTAIPNSNYSRPTMTGCRVSGQWLDAGFYCQETGY